MEEFPSNSNSKKKAVTKPEKEKVAPVVQNATRRQKKSLGTRFKNVFFGGDAKDAAMTTVTETLVPAAKAMIIEGGQELLERMVYGENRPRGRRGSSGWTDYTAPSRHKHAISKTGRMMHEFDEIVIETRPEADAVLDRLLEMLDRFEAVTVADFYDIVGQSSTPADRNWGWTSLTGADVVRARGGGYIVSLPRTENLK
jgi:hypothetical protein